MGNTYSWNIVSMESIPSLNGLTNVVSLIKWVYVGVTPEGVDGSIEGETKITTPQNENFIEYNSLSKADVITWLEETINITDLRSRIDAKINFIVNPPTITLPNPWD